MKSILRNRNSILYKLWKIHTLNDPLIKDTRFLHTGSRISIQFRLRAAALALAQAKAG
jgi:hypothetical protein